MTEEARWQHSGPHKFSTSRSQAAWLRRRVSALLTLSVFLFTTGCSGSADDAYERARKSGYDQGLVVGRKSTEAISQGDRFGDQNGREEARQAAQSGMAWVFYRIPALLAVAGGVGAGLLLQYSTLLYCCLQKQVPSFWFKLLIPHMQESRAYKYLEARMDEELLCEEHERRLDQSLARNQRELEYAYEVLTSAMSTENQGQEFASKHARKKFIRTVERIRREAEARIDRKKVRRNTTEPTDDAAKSSGDVESRKSTTADKRLKAFYFQACREADSDITRRANEFRDVWWKRLSQLQQELPAGGKRKLRINLLDLDEKPTSGSPDKHPLEHAARLRAASMLIDLCSEASIRGAKRLLPHNVADDHLIRIVTVYVVLSKAPKIPQLSTGVAQ